MTDCETGSNDTPTQCDPNTDDSCPTTPCDPNTDDSCQVPHGPQQDPPLNLKNDRTLLKQHGLEPGVCESMIVEERTEYDQLRGSNEMNELVTRETIGCYDACLIKGGVLIRVEAGMSNW